MEDTEFIMTTGAERHDERVRALNGGQARPSQQQESGAGGGFCRKRGERPGDTCNCCAVCSFGFFVFVFIFFALAVDEWKRDSRGDKVVEYNAAVDAWTTGGKADEYAAKWAGAGALPPPALVVHGAATKFAVLTSNSVALGMLEDEAMDYKRYHKVGRCGASR